MGDPQVDLPSSFRAALKAQCLEEARRRLMVGLRPATPYAQQASLARALLKAEPLQDPALRPLRLALLGSSTLEHFADILRLWLFAEGFAPQVYVPPFGVHRQETLDPSSGLYCFEPDIVWVICGFRDLAAWPAPGAGDAEVAALARQVVDDFAAVWEAMRRNTGALLVQSNVDYPPERPFGNLAGAVPWGPVAFVRHVNQLLAERLPEGSVLFDLNYVAASVGCKGWAEPRYWFHAKHAWGMDAYGPLAHDAAKLVGALKGTARKCLVLDLDNTLWGGVAADDGIEGIRLGTANAGPEGEAFVHFQRYLKDLKERGIILAVCSKNEEEIAREVFEGHPEMVLSLDDIAVFKANWQDKAANIAEIRESLNIGLDAIVFLDDNPAERELVRSLLPEVTVPDMPEDPAHYTAFLDSLRLFELVAFSDEDRQRARMYQENASRHDAAKGASDLGAFLKSLEMSSEVGRLDAYHRGRMAQLIAKSNQFHLTGTRHTEAELIALEADADTEVRYFTLTDRFGDNGLISVVVARRDEEDLDIDTWVMSCRVLSRGMEEFVIAEIAEIAADMGCAAVRGRYVPSRRNGLVRELYSRLGFTCVDEQADGTTVWRMPLADRPDYTHQITTLQQKEMDVDD